MMLMVKVDMKRLTVEEAKGKSSKDEDITEGRGGEGEGGREIPIEGEVKDRERDYVEGEEGNKNNENGEEKGKENNGVPE
jgi:hypothetical protein